MRYWAILFTMLLATQALADTYAPVIPLNQNLAMVDYATDGRQTGCGLRATGETSDHLWLNVLITVFAKGTGASFGVIKVVARKVIAEDGVPLMQNGHITYADLGAIHRAWIKPDGGKEPLLDKNGESSHGDAYMVSAEFASIVDLLLAISRKDFQVGISRNEDHPDEVFQFDRPLAQGEADKLSVCMNNLRAEMEASKRMESF